MFTGRTGRVESSSGDRFTPANSWRLFSAIPCFSLVFEPGEAKAFEFGEAEAFEFGEAEAFAEKREGGGGKESDKPATLASSSGLGSADCSSKIVLSASVAFSPMLAFTVAFAPGDAKRCKDGAVKSFRLARRSARASRNPMAILSCLAESSVATSRLSSSLSTSRLSSSLSCTYYRMSGAQTCEQARAVVIE